MDVRAIVLRARLRICAGVGVLAVLLTMVQTALANIRLEPAGAGGIGGGLAVTAGTNTTWLHADGMGNVVLATDAAGNNVAEYEYAPFGEEIARSGTFDSRFRFSSKERDPETGFYDFGYRVYAPVWQRWLSRDPLGEAADPLHNLYRFVGNNPLNAVDPLGLQMGWDEDTEAIFRMQSRLALVEPNAGNIQLREGGKAAVDSFLVGASFIPVGGAVGLSDDAVRASRGWLNARRAARVAGEYSDDATRAAGKFVGHSSKCAAKSTTRWGPATGAGPLGEEVATKFRGGSYTEMVTQEATTLYRAYGGKAEELGSYWTRTPPAGPLQARIDSALLPKWGNTAESVSTITVPKGTTIFDGFAAHQGGLMGGGSQVYIPKVEPSWIVK